MSIVFSLTTFCLIGAVSAFLTPQHNFPRIIESISSRSPLRLSNVCLIPSLLPKSYVSFVERSAAPENWIKSELTALTAKKKASGGKKKKPQSSDANEVSRAPNLPLSPIQDRLGTNQNQGLQAADAPLMKPDEVMEELKAPELKFERDRSLDSLIFEEPKGARLDEIRVSKSYKKPLIEIPDKAIVRDPKSRQDSAVDVDAAFGLSGAFEQNRKFDAI